MDEVIALLTRLVGAGHISESTVGSALAEAGWSPVGPTASAPLPRTWRKGPLHAWIQEGPAFRVEFTLWIRPVDEEWGDEGLDPVYDEAVGQLGRFVAQLRAGELAPRLADFDGDATDGFDYIEHTAWRLGKATLLLGAKQDDTDLPVTVMAVLSA